MTDTALQSKYLALASVIFLILILLLILYINNSDRSIILPSNDKEVSISAVRGLIETEYSDFKNFENQKSFAGNSVKMEKSGEDHYFAYIVSGSGLPIAQATCFRVDRSGRVFKIGLFPDPVDSYAGYRDVNPTNCKGIK